MLLVVSQSSDRLNTLQHVAQQLSLSLSFYSGSVSLGQRLSGPTRRIAMLTASDLNPDVVNSLKESAGQARLGLILAANPERLRVHGQAELLDSLTQFANLEWLAPDYDVESLIQACKRCRERMLTVTQNDLEQALIRRQFVVQYQPKVERGPGRTWDTREAEALIRWLHPERGLVGPLEFLPEAEAFDLIGPVSELVLRTTAAQLVKWRNQNMPLNGCINLASSLLSDASLPAHYAQIVTQYDLPCSAITFEVAEQYLMDADTPHQQVLATLREHGFRLSLDDFGAASSSLRAFGRIPFDEIKIHATLLAEARVNPTTRHVLAAVTGLAHNLGISVCAEGVEDTETFDFLREIECDKMQGYLISKAVMPEIIQRNYEAGPSDEQDQAVA